MRKFNCPWLTLALLLGCGHPSATTDAGTVGIGPTLQCDSSGKNAYETYGKDLLFAVTHDLVQSLTADTSGELGDSIGKIGSGDPPSTSDGLATFEGKLAAYLVHIYGGPASITYTDGKTYSGALDMKAAHAGLGITQEQYDHFVVLFAEALRANGVQQGSSGPSSPDDVYSCFSQAVADGNFSADIIGQ